MTTERRIEKYIKKILDFMPSADHQNQLSLISHRLAKEGFFIPSTKIGNKVWYIDVPHNRTDFVRAIPATVISYKLTATAEKQEEICTIYFLDRSGTSKYTEGCFYKNIFPDKKEAEKVVNSLNAQMRTVI